MARGHIYNLYSQFITSLRNIHIDICYFVVCCKIVCFKLFHLYDITFTYVYQVVTFAADFVSQLNISSKAVRVGVVAFSDEVG